MPCGRERSGRVFRWRAPVVAAGTGGGPRYARDLVAASGTNLASIGYHFGSKAGLLNAAIATVFEEWTDRLAGLAALWSASFPPDGNVPPGRT
ncbi:hypothetical protein GCM10009676_07730 [Prauserella halophila]|uniref:HTH tetR-type domain-containing protein n=1 Tax=Prauserella halophila TaxID=185641 RepID=A0ABN1W204_9PSEU|nr:transcriptional regulator, TetR family [Prauserella halophila]